MDKKEVKTFVNSAASKAAATANAKAKAATGWQRWLWAIGAIIAAAVAFFTTGCEAVTPAQIHAAHAVYHLATGSKCVIEHAEK
jgi:choline-glycine betaine transporter